jgi:hypothetical protein
MIRLLSSTSFTANPEAPQLGHSLLPVPVGMAGLWVGVVGAL